MWYCVVHSFVTISKCETTNQIVKTLQELQYCNIMASAVLQHCVQWETLAKILDMPPLISALICFPCFFSVIIFSLFLQISSLSSNFVIGFMTHLENCSEIVLLCDSFDFCRLYIWYYGFYSLHINNCNFCHVLCIFFMKIEFVSFFSSLKKMQFFSTSYVQFWIVESKKFLEWLFNSTFALFLSLYFCNESFVNAALGYYYSYTLCNSCISPPSRRNI